MMQPNANRIFWHEDGDGDSVEIISTTSKRMTLVTRSTDRPLPHATYLDRAAVEGLHATLGRWLGLNEPLTGTTPNESAGPAEDTPSLRRAAMDMAIASGHPEVALAAHNIALHLVHTLTCPARDSEACACGGGVPGVPVPVLDPEHAPATCSVCKHPEHDQGACGEYVSEGTRLCSCIASRTLHAPTPVPEHMSRAKHVTSSVMCSVCKHDPHGHGDCRAMDTLTRLRCQCLGHAVSGGAVLACPGCGHAPHGITECVGVPGESCLCNSPVPVTPRVEHAVPAPDTACWRCNHPEHGSTWCGEGGRGVHRCPCHGVPAADA